MNIELSKEYERQQKVNRKLLVIKSFVVFSLAFITLVGVVLAWFMSSDKAKIQATEFSVYNVEGISVTPGSVAETINIPCATNVALLDDDMLKNSICYKEYNVTSPDPSVYVTVNRGTSGEELKYYIRVSSDTSTKNQEYATSVKNAVTQGALYYNTSETVSLTDSDMDGIYTGTVAVIFWADYNTNNTGADLKAGMNSSSLINKNYAVTMSFQ